PDYTQTPPPREAEELSSLHQQVAEAKTKIKEWRARQNVYAGTFTQPEATYRLYRGDPLQKREQVTPAALSEFPPKMELPANSPEQERRLALARWIINPQNPLTARVTVNRIW